MAYVKGSEHNWEGIGRALGRHFRDNPDITISVLPAGAIPYFAKTRTIDMLGLNDPWVAKNGDFLSHRPGHQKISPLHYLNERCVNLVIDDPWLVRKDTAAARSYDCKKIYIPSWSIFSTGTKKNYNLHLFFRFENKSMGGD